MALSRRTGRSRLTLALLVLVSITVLTLDFRDAPVIERARDIASSAFEPVRGAAESAFEPVADAWNGITGYGALEDENARLRARVAELEGERSADENAAAQLDELLSLAEIPWAGDVERIQAQVISRPASNFDRTIDIGKGTADGIEEGMPVVTGAGLVGLVVDASARRASVQLVTDPESRVGIRVVEGGALGTAEGRGRDNDLLVNTSLDPEAVVEDDTLLATSGTDRSKFPAGIPVGRVTGTRADASGLYLELEVRPVVDLGALSYVAVLRWPVQ
ncbi:MAG: rod shape-determining protein MreC [Acidimicrobiia bacterium]